MIFEDDTEAAVNDAKMRGRSSRGTQEVYIGTPDRLRKDKRRGEPDDMEDDDHKQRRFDDDQAMSIPGSPDDQPEFKHQKIDDDMLDSMDEVDRKILAASILGVDITEVYSPERIAKVARKFGLQAGSFFDLTNGWDFNVEEHRRKAWVKIKEESPYLLIGSPPCTYFSMLQELNVAVHGHKPEWIEKFGGGKAESDYSCSILLRTLQVSA